MKFLKTVLNNDSFKFISYKLQSVIDKGRTNETYLAGLKFSFNESDSKLPDIGLFLNFNANESACSSESLWIELLPPPHMAPCILLLSAATLLLLCGIWSAWLLLLSSVGNGAQAEKKENWLEEFSFVGFHKESLT